MEKTTDKAVSRIAVEISKDRLTAWIHPCDAADPRPIEKEEIVAALAVNKIKVGEEVHTRIDAFLALPAEGEDAPERFVIAEGKAACEGTDGEFLWDESLKKEGNAWQGDAPINYYTLNSIITIEQGRRIGTIVAPKPRVNGFDVLGNKLTPTQRPTEIQLQSTVGIAAEDPGAVIANVAGKVVYEHGTVSMDEVLEIGGDVDLESGNVDSVVDVHVKGTVRDLFSVKSKKSVSVCGAIEAAEVNAQDDILVRGGILGRERAAVTAGGEIVAKFCDQANLTAEGDIKITREIINSEVRAEGKLVAGHGVIIGSNIYAREGVEVGTLGSDACVPTTIMIGIHPDLIREAEKIRCEMEAKKKEAERIRTAIQPLMAELKRLQPEQKERVTELMFQADAIDIEVTDEETRREALLAEGRAPEPPYVLVNQMIHPVTTIRIGRRQVFFEKEFAGPVRIEKRKVENVTEFVAVNQLSGSITVLPSSYVMEKEITTETDSAPSNTGH